MKKDKLISLERDLADQTASLEEQQAEEEAMEEKKLNSLEYDIKKLVSSDT